MFAESSEPAFYSIGTFEDFRKVLVPTPASTHCFKPILSPVNTPLTWICSVTYRIMHAILDHACVPAKFFSSRYPVCVGAGARKEFLLLWSGDSELQFDGKDSKQ